MLVFARNSVTGDDASALGHAALTLLEQFLDRLLSAGASVDPTVYKLAFMLRGGHVELDDGPDVRFGS